LLPIRPGRPGGHGGYTGPLISQRQARIRGATMGTSSLTIAAALGQYEQNQSGFAVLPQTARHAVLEIGDHMHRLREALRLAELGPASWLDHLPPPIARRGWLSTLPAGAEAAPGRASG
jgi:hypothetical protein